MKKLNGDNCEKFVHNNLNVQVTNSILQNLLLLCEKYENSKDHVKIKEIVSNLQCDPNARLSKVMKPFVALASFPGSGNTMTRQIVEVLTGILTAYDGMVINCTSRCYRYIIKTHKMHFGPDDEVADSRNYTEAVYIIRNPYKAIYAEYNIYYASVNRQGLLLSNGTYFGKKWERYVRFQAENWKEMTIFWLKNFRRPVHVLFYEKVIENRLTEVFRLSKFLGVNLTVKLLLCTFSQYVEGQKRKYPVSLSSKRLFDLYSNQLIEQVNGAIIQTFQSVHLNEIRDYILPFSYEN